MITSIYIGQSQSHQGTNLDALCANSCCVNKEIMFYAFCARSLYTRHTSAFGLKGSSIVLKIDSYREIWTPVAQDLTLTTSDVLLWNLPLTLRIDKKVKDHEFLVHTRVALRISK